MRLFWEAQSSAKEAPPKASARSCRARSTAAWKFERLEGRLTSRFSDSEGLNDNDTEAIKWGSLRGANRRVASSNLARGAKCFSLKPFTLSQRGLPLSR